MYGKTKCANESVLSSHSESRTAYYCLTKVQVHCDIIVKNNNI